MKNEKLIYNNHSGGAIGADTYWGSLGEEYGVISHHYWYQSPNPASKPEDELTEDEFEEGKEKVYLANKTFKRQPERYMYLLSRNWLQVKNSECIFAIGILKTKCEVNGGTGWAVQMAIDCNKPVYVFDQNKNKWFYFNFDKGIFEYSVTPVLTTDFAGIGTRKINENGISAIKNVYKKTFR